MDSPLAQQLIAALGGGDPHYVAMRAAELFALHHGCHQVRFAWRHNSSPGIEIAGWSKHRGRFQERPLPGEDTLPAETELGTQWERLFQDLGFPDPTFEAWWECDPPTAMGVCPQDVSLCTQALLAACQLQRSLHEQKLAALAEYAAGAGHEINNPLGSIIGRVAQLRRDEADPEKRRALETVGAQAYRIRDMIGDTMLIARPPAPQLEQVLWNELLARVVATQQELAAEKQLTIECIVADELKSSADATQMAVVFSELLRNAIQASEIGAAVQIAAQQQDAGSVPGILFTVRDTGHGFTDEQLQHCFDPFYSGRQAGRGLGFGLTKVWRIVQQHAGHVEVHSHEHETSFLVWLPLAGGAA